MHPEDIQKTAVTTPFGTFTFNYSCFGSKAATIGFPSTDSSRHTFQTMTPTYCTPGRAIPLTLDGALSLRGEYCSRLHYKIPITTTTGETQNPTITTIGCI